MAFTCRVQYLDDTDPFASTVFPEPTRPPSFTFNEYLPLLDQLQAVHRFLKAPHKLEDCTLQLSHNGYYLDLESSIDEQKDDLENFNKERKHSILLRSQLSVRVHGCIEKLLNSTGRELRRALFSLKQIFQDDKDLVHEFVSADGLACLIQVGTDADQNYQNYILRALGQIMLYVDGMNGVIEHTDTVQWLYSLLASKYRLVVKTSLKLLLVFVEYTDTNAAVLFQATCVVDKEQGKPTWSNVMQLLKDEGQDSEVLLYAMSLINKTLNIIPDQDTFYDITDSLEQQQIEEATKMLMSQKGTDLDLVEQFKLYEYALKQEDGDIDIPVERKQNLRKHRRSAELVDRKSLRRSLKPTAEYSVDKRELRRSLDLGTSLSPVDARRINESGRRRDNRRNRPRLSMDNAVLSDSPTTERTVQEILEERRMRRRTGEQDESGWEDTSGPTTDISTSEYSSTKIPWRRGRTRQPPGQNPPTEGDVSNIKAGVSQGEQGELQQVLAERRQRRREMRQREKEEESQTQTTLAASPSVSPGIIPAAATASKDALGEPPGNASPGSEALQQTRPKLGSSVAAAMSKFTTGDGQKAGQEGGTLRTALAKRQSLQDKTKGSESVTEDREKEQSSTLKVSGNKEVPTATDKIKDLEPEDTQSQASVTEGMLEKIQEEAELDFEQDPLGLLSKEDLRYDPNMDASSETGTSFTPIYPSSSTSSLAAYYSVTPTTEGSSDAEQDLTNVSDSEGYLTLPSEEDADSHTPIVAERADLGKKIERPKFVLSSEVSVTSVKSSDSDTAGRRMGASLTRITKNASLPPTSSIGLKFSQSHSRDPPRKELPAQDDEEDLMALLSMGCPSLAPEGDHSVAGYSPGGSDTEADVSEITDDSDQESLADDLNLCVKELPQDERFVHTYYESPGKTGSLSSSQKVAKTTFVQKAGIAGRPDPRLTSKAHQKDDNDELMALLGGGIMSDGNQNTVKDIGGEDEDTLSILSQGPALASESKKVRKNDKEKNKVQVSKVREEDDVLAILSQGFEPVPAENRKGVTRDKVSKEEEEEEDLISLLSQGIAPPVSEPESRISNSTSKYQSSKLEGVQDQPNQDRLQENAKESRKDGRKTKRQEREDEEDVLAVLSRGIPEPSGKELNRNQNASQSFHRRFREVPEEAASGRTEGEKPARGRAAEDKGQRSLSGEEVHTPHWRRESDKPTFSFKAVHDEPPGPVYTPRNRRSTASQRTSTSSSSPWSARSTDMVLTPNRSFPASPFLYGRDESASNWLNRANPVPIEIPKGNRSLQHFDKPRKSSQSVTSEPTASPVAQQPGTRRTGICELDDDVFGVVISDQPAASTEDTSRALEPSSRPPRPQSKDSSPARQPTGDEDLLRLLSGGDAKARTKPSESPAPSYHKPTTPTYKSTPSSDYTRPSTDPYRPSYKSSPSGRESRPLPSSYPSPASSTYPSPPPSSFSYKPSSRLPSTTSSVPGSQSSSESTPPSARWIDRYNTKFGTVHSDDKDKKSVTRETAEARLDGHDALPSRTRPIDIATTPTRTQPKTDTTPSRVRQPEEDPKTRARPAAGDDTSARRHHHGRDATSVSETPSSVRTPSDTTTPADTDYVTERRRRRKERETQRAAEAEAAEKQTATLPRNFKPPDCSTPLATTEYVSHRRRNRDDKPDETVSTTVTASKPAEVTSPTALENGEVGPHRRRRRRSSTKADTANQESKADEEAVKALLPPDYLSSGIAARRKLRQEQREQEIREEAERQREAATSKRPVPVIREPTSSLSEEEENKGQRSTQEVTGLTNGDSSGLDAVTSEASRTSSPESCATSDDTVLEKTAAPAKMSNHVDPLVEKSLPSVEAPEKQARKEDKEPLSLKIDREAAWTAKEGSEVTGKAEEDTQKGHQEPPMSAGLTNNKRYQLEMMYSNRNSLDEPAVGSPSRKISSSLENHESITNRIDKLHKKPDEVGEDEGLTMVASRDIGVTEGTVQSVQEKLQSPRGAATSPADPKETGPTGDKTGAINLAKQGLKSVNIPMKQPGASLPVKAVAVSPEVQQEAQWQELLRQNNRELRISGWDFTDLSTKDDKNVFTVTNAFGGGGVVPAPPPPPMGGLFVRPPPAPPVPPMAPGHYGTLPPPPPPLSTTATLISDGYNTYPPKKKKTVRLFWKETRLDRLSVYGRNDPKDTIWGGLGEVQIDKRKLEHLFESKAKEILQKKILEAGKKHVISVLDAKRSNHINIALTALPHPSTIKQAIMKMDGTAVNKEGIEKLLTMVPSEEESNLIKESTVLNPDIPLGSAEQFLHMLSNITVLKARLNLWLFKMDYESMEEEVAEPLAELKKGIEDLKNNQTFRQILSILLAVGNFLNGAQVQGFHIDYLAKVPDIKDTVHKQSLLYHLCGMVSEQFPDSTDLFSELASISRCAKVDFEVLETNLQKMEEQCKASWEHLRIINKHDSHSPLKNKLQDFLADCNQRIIVLKIVHRRVLNRFNELLLFLGMTASAVRELKITEFCKIISEFALEYRTTRERVLEQEKKKANHRKRAMTRGKMITENLTLSQDKEEDAKLKALLKNHVGSTAPGDEALRTRTRNKPNLARQSGMDVESEVYSDNHATDSPYDDMDTGMSASTSNMEDVGDEQTDEMLQIIVNTAKNTKTRNTPRERKRGRSNRKSLRRTLKGGTGLTEAESRALGLHPSSKTVHV